ncbi:PepSY domain-containing protein [Lysinibacter sp. HNR]|uniref:PepSY domain-containing protein n=1 Tax=Lysinibacter sp. HNR TaxID=3031408 RepID=UPI002434E2F8|nr:PepSY domain-containing protein [Lysinibacter sp. HNR]WGD38518.1 PepSY domain-containing protein [Lysinibacter sp. HNR]
MASIGRKKYFVGALVLTTSLSMSGCVQITPLQTRDTTPPAPNSPQDSSDIIVPDEADTPGALDALRAIDVALTATPGAVVELGLEQERGRQVWEVGILRTDNTGVELYVDRESGDILRETPLRLSREQTTAPAVTAHQAIETAVQTIPGRVVYLDLDSHRSNIVWEVIVQADSGSLFELYINAATGEVVKQERYDD